MAKKKKKTHIESAKAEKSPGVFGRVFGQLDQPQRERLRARISKVTIVLVVVVCICVGFAGLDRYVHKIAGERDVFLTVRWRGRPYWASEELIRSITLACGIRSDDFILDQELPREWTSRLRDNPWVKRVNHIWRRYDGVVEIDCELREPIAKVIHGQVCSYIDADGVVLPDASVGLHLVELEGTIRALPGCGESVNAEDLLAGLEVLEMIRLMDQELPGKGRLWGELAKVDVSNHEGRINPAVSHLMLYTRDDTEIRWGAAIGRSVPYHEASWKQKLSKLYRKYKQYGVLSRFKSIELRDVRQDRPDPMRDSG